MRQARSIPHQVRKLNLTCASPLSGPTFHVRGLRVQVPRWSLRCLAGESEHLPPSLDLAGFAEAVIEVQICTFGRYRPLLCA